MKIYVAAPWVCKAGAKEVGAILRENGFTVVSRWHETTLNSGIYEAPPTIMAEEAIKDWTDVQTAEALLYLNLVKSEGKATELGISLSRGIPIYVVGGRENNVFLHLPQINHVDSIAKAIEALRETRSV